MTTQSVDLVDCSASNFVDSAQRPAHRNREGAWELLEERQGRGPEAPLRPWVRADRPAYGSSTPTHHDACQPDCPHAPAGGVQRDDDAGAGRQDTAGHLHQRWTDVRLGQRWVVPPPPHASQTRAARARLCRRQGASEDGWGGPRCQQEAHHGPRHRPTHRRVHGPKSWLDPGLQAVVSYVRGSHHWFLLHHWGVLVRTSGLTASGFVIFQR
jgi:hypothetical protein